MRQPNPAPRPAELRQPPRHEDIARVVLIYAASAALWILLSDKAVGLLFSDSSSILVASMLKGWLFVVVTSAVLWVLIRQLLARVADPAGEGRSIPSRRSSVVLVALVSLAVTGVVVASVIHTLASQRDKEALRLKTIAHIMSAWVSDWVNERRADMALLSNTSNLPALYRRWQDSADANARSQILARLEQFRAMRDYHSVLLLDPDGIPLPNSFVSGTGIAPPLAAAIRSLAQDKSIVTVGPYRDATGALHLDIVARLATDTGRPGPIVVLQTDPTAALYPRLQQWAQGTASGETMLYRRDGEQYLLLNDLRHRHDTAATLRLPRSEHPLLAVLDAGPSETMNNVVEGTDYRQSAVLGVATAVAGTDWVLLAKLDRNEVYAQGMRDSRIIGLAGLLALIITVTAALLFRQRRALDLQRRVNAEQEQRIRTLQLLEAIADNSADAIFAKDVAGRYLLFNREARRIIGRASDSDIIGLTDHEIFPSAQAHAFVDSDREVMAQDRHASYEETLATAQGEAEFLTTKCPLHDAHGNVIGVFGIARDITVMRQAERALRDREQMLAAIVGNSPSTLSLKHPDGRYVLANPNLQRILGLSEAEIVGKTDFELYPEATARSYRANDEEVLSTRLRSSVEEVVPVAAEARTFMSHIFPVLGDDAQVQYICRISLDITERKRAQESLQQLADDMRGTLQAIPDLLFELDEDGRYVGIKATQEPMLAVPADQLLGRVVSDVLPPEAARTMMDALNHARSTGADYGRTITLPMATGPRTFELSLARKPIAAGRPVHFVVVSRDVTARVEAEASLRRQTTELAHRNAELERFNRVVVGRELDVIRLKQQVNALSHELGREAPFALSFLNSSQPGERASPP